MIASHTHTLRQAEIQDIDAWQELSEFGGLLETLRRYRGSNQVHPSVYRLPARLRSLSRNPVFPSRSTVSEWRDSTTIKPDSVSATTSLLFRRLGIEKP